MTVVASELDGRVPIDRLGAAASTICAVHCVICALLPATFGAMGLGVLLGHEVEWGFTLVAVIFAASALTVSWRRHQSRVVATLLVLGIAGLVASRCLEMGAEHHSDQHAKRESSERNAAHPPSERGVAELREQSASDHVSHVAGAGVGVLAGLLLCAGHLLNLRATHRCQRNCA